MAAFIIHRLLQAFGVLLAVGLIAFAMFRFAGDPVNQIVSIDTPAAEREQVRRSLGLDDPVPVQFARYLSQAARLDFGISYQFRQPVTTLLAERMPATIELALSATILALGFGILMGVVSALHRTERASPRCFQAVSLIPACFALRPFSSASCSSILRRDSRLAALLRARGPVQLGWWLHGSSPVVGTQGADPALHHPRAVPDDADHAPGAGRDAGGAAHRLHPLRRARGLRPARSISAMRSRTRSCRDHHRGLSSARSSPSRSSPRPCSSGPAWACSSCRPVQNVDIPIMAAYLLLVALIFVGINLVVDILYTVVDPRLRAGIRRPA
jgi:peptide/nickel transport system permease protein